MNSCKKHNLFEFKIRNYEFNKYFSASEIHQHYFAYSCDFSDYLDQGTLLQ
jgi:hypothetical protein